MKETEKLNDKINEVLTYAINYIKSFNSKEFTAVNESIGDDITFKDKIIAETSLLLVLVKRSGLIDEKNSIKIRELLKFINLHVRSTKNRQLLLKKPTLASVFGLGHYCLNLFEIMDREFDELILNPFRNKKVYNVERLPYRLLDVYWLHETLLPNSKHDFNAVLPFTILNKEINLDYATSRDIYALTHTIMYLTDFGKKQPTNVNLVDLNSKINTAIRFHLLSDNLDILGELVMMSAMLNLPVTIEVKMAVNLISYFWDSFGFLPSPTFNLDEYNRIKFKKEYIFKNTYHTLYVGLMMEILNFEMTNRKKMNFQSIVESKYKLKEKINFIKDKLDIFLYKNFDVQIVKSIQEKLVVEICDSKYIIKKKYLPKRFTAKYILNLSNSTEKHVKKTLDNCLISHLKRDYNINFLTCLISGLIKDKSIDFSQVISYVEFIFDQQLPNGAIGVYFFEKKSLERRELLELMLKIRKTIIAISDNYTNAHVLNFTYDEAH